MRNGVPLLVGAFLLNACSGAVGPADERAQVQKLFDDREAAIGRGDRVAFEASLDPEASATFRRTQAEFFSFQSSYGLSNTHKVVRVETYRADYNRVWTQSTRTRARLGEFRLEPVSYGRAYVRSAQGRWILTEPPVDLLGGEKIRVIDELELHYWAIDDDVVDAAAFELAAAQRAAVAALPSPLTSPRWKVTLYPTAGSAGPGWTYYVTGANLASGETSLYPTFVSFSASLKEWDRDARVGARMHAYHWARKALLPGISARLNDQWWLVWGWPLAQAYADVGVETFHQPACTGVGFPSLKQLSDGPPAPGTPGWNPDNLESYFVIASSMSGYLFSEFGAPKYWELMREYLRDVDATSNFSKILGVTPSRFYADWAVWAKKKYC